MKKLNIKKLSFIKLLPVILLFFVFTGAKPGGGDDDIYTEINKNMDVFGRVYKEIALNYVDAIDPGKFMQAGINGMLSTLDPYTNFLDQSRTDIPPHHLIASNSLHNVLGFSFDLIQLY